MIKILYITYDGIMDPLGQSQVMPYLTGLASLGTDITLLSFEKPQSLRNKEKVDKTSEELRDSRIRWSVLRYHKRPTLAATSYDIIRGLMRALLLIKRNSIGLIHARSYVPAYIAYLSGKITRTRYIFDMRGLWADEKVDGGAWSKDAWLYKITKKLEKTLLLNSAGITVLTQRVKGIIEDFDYMKTSNLKIDVIPTCVDLRRFNVRDADEDILNSLNARGKFILFYLGSVGTWYMLREMIDFFKEAKEKIKNSFFLFLVNNGREHIEDEMKRQGIGLEDFCVRSASYQDVPRWLSVASASIFFIKPSFSKKSSCATKFGESLACGVPVVINSEIGDTDGIVKSDRIGVVIDKFALDSYKKGVDELLGLMKDGDNLRMRCRSRATASLSLNNGVNYYHMIYETLWKNKK